MPSVRVASSLAAFHALNAGAEDLADIGAGDQAERQDAQRIGRWPEQLAADPGEALPDDQDRDDGRQAAEDIGVDARQDPEQRFSRDAHDRQHHADHDAEQRRGRGQDQRVLQADHDHVRQYSRHRLPVEEAAAEIFEPVHSIHPA